MQPKLVYFHSHPIQYIAPMLKELAKEVDLEVYYYSDANLRGGVDKGFGQAIKWDIPLLDGYKSTFLKNYNIGQPLNLRLTGAINPSVFGIMLRTKSKVVMINGWSYATDLMILFTAWFFGKKVWLRVENPLSKDMVQQGLKPKIKAFLFKNILFTRLISRFLYIGTDNKDFFQ